MIIFVEICSNIFPSFLNMERFMVTTFNISRVILVLQHITSNKTKKYKKMIGRQLPCIESNGLGLMTAPILEKYLGPLMPKWSNYYASRKGKNHRQHVTVIFVTRDLEMGVLLVKQQELNTHMWAMEICGLLVTVKVLKLKTYIGKVLREKKLYLIL